MIMIFVDYPAIKQNCISSDIQHNLHSRERSYALVKWLLVLYLLCPISHIPRGKEDNCSYFGIYSQKEKKNIPAMPNAAAERHRLLLELP